MNLARFSVTRPVAVTMRIAALVLLGAICLLRLPIDLLPKVSLPTVAVNVTWPNVAPEEIEAQITRPIEQAVSSAPNLYEVSSSTSQGSSTVRVQFQWGTDIGQAAVDVLQLVQRASQNFPNDPTLESPVVFKYDPSTMPILIYGVSGIDDPIKLRTLLDNQVSPIIESASGVASAAVTGGQERAVVVNVDPDRLRAYHLSLPDVTRRIAQENLNVPAGIAKQGNTEYTIRSLGWFTNIDELRSIPVGAFNGSVIPLSSVADVRDESSETRLYTRLNGKPAVGLIVTKQSEANTVDTAHAVRDKIEQVKKLYPQLKFGLAYNQSQFIENSIHEVTEAAVIGGVLAVLILLFFLRNVRSTLVVALSIPVSITSTFALLYMCGFTLNTMSLGGLALATGLIVDDAVVVLENIFRHIERDKKRAPDAAVSGATEIFSAVVASTFTIVVVFLPLMLIRGQAGQMFTQFALVVIFSILVSLLDATTVVPMLASRVIKGEAHHEMIAGEGERTRLEKIFAKCGVWLNALDASYRHGLSWALHHRYRVLAGAAILSAASFLLLPYIGTEMMPQADSGDFSVNIKMPVGTSLQKTNETVGQIENILMKDPDVATVFSAAGTSLTMRGTTRSQIPFQGSATVKLKEHRSATTLQVMQRMRKAFGRIPGVRAMPNQFDIVTMMMTGGPENVEVDIFGDDIATLSRLSREVMAKVRNVSGLENVDVNWQEATPEIQWKVDRQKALQLGMSFSDVAGTIGTATNGTIASYYQEEGFQYPIIVQLPENKRKTVPELLNLAIRPTTGQNTSGDIFLSQVARPVYGMGPSEITRLNRQRYVAITGSPQGRSSGEIQEDVQKALSGMTLPEGYRWDWGSNMQRRSREFSGMWLSIAMAIALIYMLLASQFESFIHPLTVLASVPLCAIGVILALFLTDRSFGLTAFIGLLMLVGIVVKNGILLVDYTNVLRGRGVPRDEAVLTAGPTRLRPILMTALAAGFGMLPLAIGLGNGSEVQAPMATAVIGGLFTSTLLTLFVVPVVYTLFDDLGRNLRQSPADLAPPELVEPSVEAVGDELSPAPVTEPTTPQEVL
ncbi:MAG: efflux RND transporter permease subunit [Armatimonadetes bacterium]|nr:efflux RND transporter permease subunit [Armatimonadota bacterium]